MDPLTIIVTLRTVLATASGLSDILKKLQSGEQPTAEDADLVASARRLATDDLVAAIDAQLKG